MSHNRNISFYLVVGFVFIVLKYWFTTTDTNDFYFLLKPISKFLNVVSGYNAVYSPQSGFHYDDLNIVIDKSCSGFNFWLISFLAFSFVSIKNLQKTKAKLISIPLMFIGSYVFSILVNTSRILISILVQSKTVLIFEGHQSVIHEAIGVVTNLTFLILAYLLIDITLSKKQRNANFIEPEVAPNP